MSFMNSNILENVTVSVNEDTGVKTVTGTAKEESITSSLVTYATSAFKVNNDDTYVAESTAAKGAIVTGLFSAHLMDFLHARNGAAPISPLTRMIVS